ncbi:hypothetical protein AVEN_183827-1 [Araneus ventricosus]|uniref:Endonuclease/exonuclease/phosphatase domain-containing protein n=1 Tax=Araneus ventricosus TaxID=182803 RepID=A0A4Y2N8L4_ARAVE|nr:hypothetical protein AVEN_183827-1 [Araneus ventricosus]
MKWQRHWDQEINNKLHSIKPIIENWSEDVNRKRSTILTRLRIGHTRFTHRHLLLEVLTLVEVLSRKTNWLVLLRLKSWKAFLHKVPFAVRRINIKREDFISQLPVPFLLLGDLNGHNPLWGSPNSNIRGNQIEQLLTDHKLCLLNTNKPTYFHQPTKPFHTIDLAICSPSILPFFDFAVENNLHDSDHFPLVLTDNRIGRPISFLPRRYVFDAADWVKFALLAKIASDVVNNNSIDEAISQLIKIIIDAANVSIPFSKSSNRRQNKPWWNNECQQAQEKPGKA